MDLDDASVLLTGGSPGLGPYIARRTGAYRFQRLEAEAQIQRREG